ncbi:hypothetical protein [Paenibacillus sp. LPE1-1-1.1]|uniref:hypothetical protein n=1 Tax=Paenibacillus sp. LPE1-1-1.1 TaxID=3135230 RepID=UPI00341CA2B8
MRIDDYVGLVVIVELDTSETYEGFLELVEDAEGAGYVKVVNAESIKWIPRDEVYKITPIPSKNLIIK